MAETGCLKDGHFQNLDLAGTALTATAAELNLLDASNTGPADGEFVSVSRWAKAEWSFADGGAQGDIPLGVTIPINSIIVSGFVEVIEQCATDQSNTGTGALSIETGNDLVTTVAVISGLWQTPGTYDIGPGGTGSSAIKCSDAKHITFTIAGQNFTAGKFNVWLQYVIGE